MSLLRFTVYITVVGLFQGGFFSTKAMEQTPFDRCMEKLKICHSNLAKNLKATFSIETIDSLEMCQEVLKECEKKTQPMVALRNIKKKRNMVKTPQSQSGENLTVTQKDYLVKNGYFTEEQFEILPQGNITDLVNQVKLIDRVYSLYLKKEMKLKECVDFINESVMQVIKLAQNVGTFDVHQYSTLVEKISSLYFKILESLGVVSYSEKRDYLFELKEEFSSQIDDLNSKQIALYILSNIAKCAQYNSGSFSELEIKILWTVWKLSQYLGKEYQKEMINNLTKGGSGDSIQDPSLAPQCRSVRLFMFLFMDWMAKYAETISN
jgi:hypothetical protein